MKRIVPLFVVLFGSVIFCAQAYAAGGALAVGIPPNVKAQGFVWGFGTGNNPQQQALAICRGVDLPAGIVMPASASEAKKLCKLVGNVQDQCYAIAQDKPNLANGVNAVGWAIAATLLVTENQALDMCMANAPPSRKAECRITARACVGSAK